MHTQHQPSSSQAMAAPPPWTETLRDGSRVTIRPMTAADADVERRFIESLSPTSRRLRFLGQVAHPDAELIRRLTDVDFRHDAAFAAVAADSDDHALLGVSRYSTSADGTSCECAVTVLDAWQHRGLGTVLMKHLIDVARSRGIRSMHSIDAIDNVGMAELAGHFGFERSIDPEDPTQAIHRLRL